MGGRITLGLYNCYDKQWQDIMRITLARAAPVAMAFDCDLVAFAFPFDQVRERGGLRTKDLRTPREVAAWIEAGTSIGEGGAQLSALAAAGRFKLEPALTPRADTPFGKLIVTTPHPDAAKAQNVLRIVEMAVAGDDLLVLFGLGPRGLPPALVAAPAIHLEFTGKGIPFETATALGALPALMYAHLQHLRPWGDKP